MIYDAIQKSVAGGKPIRLFIYQQQLNTLRFAHAKEDFIDSLGTVYTAAEMTCGPVRQTPEPKKDTLQIEFPYFLNPNLPPLSYPSTQTLGDWWRRFVPTNTIRVTCCETHYGATDPPKVFWMGRVTAPELLDGKMTLSCERGSAFMRSKGQGWRWQTACPKTVYSTGPLGCHLDPAPLTVTGALTAVDGVTIVAAEFATAPIGLTGGWIEWVRADGIVDRRTIMKAVGDTLTIQYGSDDLAIGSVVSATPPCEQNWSACELRENTDNYGGAIYKPLQDPLKDSMSWG